MAIFATPVLGASRLLALLVLIAWTVILIIAAAGTIVGAGLREGALSARRKLGGALLLVSVFVLLLAAVLFPLFVWMLGA